MGSVIELLCIFLTIKVYLSDIKHSDSMKNIFCSFLTITLIVFANVSEVKAQQINAKIQEVYGDKTQELVVNDPARMAFLNDLLDSRIKIIESELSSSDKYTKLSSVALVNKYNSSLARDIGYDLNTFNVLKYDLKFSSKNTEIYRIDNTNYLIVIQPQIIKND